MGVFRPFRVPRVGSPHSAPAVVSRRRKKVVADLFFFEILQFENSRPFAFNNNTSHTAMSNKKRHRVVADHDAGAGAAKKLQLSARPVVPAEEGDLSGWMANQLVALHDNQVVLFQLVNQVHKLLQDQAVVLKKATIASFNYSQHRSAFTAALRRRLITTYESHCAVQPGFKPGLQGGWPSAAPDPTTNEWPVSGRARRICILLIALLCLSLADLQDHELVAQGRSQSGGIGLHVRSPLHPPEPSGRGVRRAYRSRQRLVSVAQETLEGDDCRRVVPRVR